MRISLNIECCSVEELQAVAQCLGQLDLKLRQDPPKPGCPPPSAEETVEQLLKAQRRLLSGCLRDHAGDLETLVGGMNVNGIRSLFKVLTGGPFAGQSNKLVAAVCRACGEDPRLAEFIRIGRKINKLKWRKKSGKNA